MKANLRRVIDIYYFEGDKKIKGAPSGVSGNLTDVRGDLTGVSGNLTGVWGDLTDVRGNLTGVCGDLSDCDITDKDRREGIDISVLIREDAEGE